jgi:hypothetical protein
LLTCSRLFFWVSCFTEKEASTRKKGLPALFT